MKKTKKEKMTELWKQPLPSFKSTLTYFILLSILALCVFILGYRYVHKITASQEFVYQNSISTSAHDEVPTPVPELPSAPVPLSPSTSGVTSSSLEVFLQNEINTQNKRLSEIEAKLNKLHSIPQVSHQLLAMEILREVLEGHVPLSTFVLYLEKMPEPWGVSILNSISAIPECKTYDQLRDSLILSQKPLSRWQRVKSYVKSFVRIRKLDETGHYVEGHLDDIYKALRKHDIEQALTAFDKLSPKEQTELALWKQEAQNRLTLERIKQKILLDLVGGQ